MKTLSIAVGAWFLVAPHPAVQTPPCVDSPANLVACASADRETDAIVSVTIDDVVQNGAADPVAALAILLDKRPVEELLIFPGTGRRSYSAIVGPLPPGPHEISLRPSTVWPAPKARVHDLGLRLVRETDPDFLAVHHAPGVWARADTIGKATDVLLGMYVERRQEPNGSDALTYSVIFSNEDGGTSTRALMARWGRTTDIEWMYTVRLSSGRVASEEYQARDHDTRTFEGTHVGSHAILLVATLNNVFADRGRTSVLLRPVPKVVDLTAATRESVMDAEPWMYRVMSRELSAESKIREDARWPVTMIDDPRAYVYVEAEMTLQNATAAATVQDDRGVWRSSHLGLADLTVARDGFVRVAVPTEGTTPQSIGWTCLPKAASAPAVAPTSFSSCRIRLLRALRLDPEYRVQPFALAPADFQLKQGEMRAVTLTSR